MRVKVTIDGILAKKNLGTVQAMNEIGALFQQVYKFEFLEMKEE